MHEDFAEFRAEFRDIHSELKEIRRQIEILQGDMQSVKGFVKELDHLLRHAGAIEARLGIPPAIPA